MSGGHQSGPETQSKIDYEVRKLVDEAYERAKKILKKHKADLDRLAEGLLEYETLTGDEITQVIAGKALNRDGIDDYSDDKGGPPSLTAVPKAGKFKRPPGEGKLSPQS